MTFEQAMKFISSFTKSGEPVRNLDRIAGLLNQVGNPQNKLKCIHIAGTNGKGSVAEYLTNILKESGYRTGTLTSPYIKHYQDRIRINGQDIPEKILCELCEGLQATVTGGGYSQFEITMVIAFLYFVRKNVDVVVLETGIGGLLDATNIIEKPLVSVLTSVSKDHTEILGDTIEKIAYQKAGIIKNGCPVVISLENKGETIFRKTAEQKHCQVFQPKRENIWYGDIALTGNEFFYYDIYYRTKMGGEHQVDNAVTVLETVNVLRNQNFKIPEMAVHQGLFETVVPARIQILQEHPLVILDGGHNPDGTEALADLLKGDRGGNYIGICGMTSTKDADTASGNLASVFSEVLCVDGFAPNALPKEQLAGYFRKHHTQAGTANLEDALPNALALAEQNQNPVVICGSLYLASWYLKQR
ncbi:MAG: bifunctional folylpolyglutamate synthase/dihydrofolate synthase [Oscillospiraceae bacterium]|nr:bifunctional folylpolyglutamate synthase/dihydrofolate synthase [Oscillospiraceae bacterium]